jgi:EAL domain-containing protein (putative c-di-GMP-specific phosphodiesterase class I)
MSVNVVGTDRVVWLLTGQFAEDEPVRHVRVDVVPFTIGRQGESSLSIPSPTVSRRHAELHFAGEQLRLVDLGSTNGTFVNGIRIQGTCQVNHGDLLQFGNVVFRVNRQKKESVQQTMAEDSCDRALALIQFDQLLTQRAVVPHYQPIVNIKTGGVFGYEVLGRSRLFGLKDPHSMFSAAKVLDLEGELSRIMREEGIECGRILPPEHLLFVNTHPVEMEDIDLLVLSLRELRESAPQRPLVLEIHEAAVTHSDQMKILRAALTELGIKLAYDDFGAGQARLVELIEVPPDYLKFDMKLVQHLDKASLERVKLLSSLIRTVHDMGIEPLAEGIETAAENKICRELGFTCAQGYFYGRPAQPKTLLEQVHRQTAPQSAESTLADSPQGVSRGRGARPAQP